MPPDSSAAAAAATGGVAAQSGSETSSVAQTIKASQASSTHGTFLHSANVGKNANTIKSSINTIAGLPSPPRPTSTLATAPATGARLVSAESGTGPTAPGGRLLPGGGSGSFSGTHSRSLSNPVNRASSSSLLGPSLVPVPSGPTPLHLSSDLPNNTTIPGPSPFLDAITSISTNPTTPNRPNIPRGLSLQLPTRNQPLPPYLDPALGFSTVRRPRLDFARSCTSLHHSFVADSPESSPLTPSMPIPRRPLDSPIAMHIGGTSSILSSLLADSHVLSDDSSDSSSDDEMDLTSAHSQFGPSLGGSGGNDMFGSTGLLNRHHMTRLRGNARSSRQSSSSASSTSMASPAPSTPPNGEVKNSGAGGYFGTQVSDMLAQRRHSLTQALKKIEFAAEEGRAADVGVGRQLDAIRRPVTRRGNLLPKPKHFQRVKAALIEEATPIDAEMRIEAAITRQLREDEDEDCRTVPQTPVMQAQPEDEQPLVFEDTEDESNGVSFKSAAQRNSGYWGSLESSSPSGFMGFRMNPDGDIVMGTDSMVNSPISRSPEVRKMKRRRDDDDFPLDQPSIIKRRAVSPSFSQSPTVSSSPVAIPANAGPGSNIANGTRSKRSSYIHDAHDGMSKMSITPFL